MSFFAPDAVWERLAGDERVRGLTAIRGVVEDLYRPYEEFETEMKEQLDLMYRDRSEALKAVGIDE